MKWNDVYIGNMYQVGFTQKVSLLIALGTINKTNH